jgi:hypothetical protein
MSIITAYKCDTTGKLFEGKAKYQKHLRKIACERRVQRKIDAACKSDLQWWHDNFWNRVGSLPQLQAAILYHKDVFAARGVKNYNRNRSDKDKLNPTPIVRFDIFNLTYSDQVSNSHCSPHDGVKNHDPHADHNKGKPNGYLGWRGSFRYLVQSCKGQEGYYPGSSDMWCGTRIHTGSGGGGTSEQRAAFQQSFGYSLTLFASDWPAMAAEYEKANMFKILSGDVKSLDTIVNEWNPVDNLTFE